MEPKTVLLDVLKHTAGLGMIEAIKITGTDESTQLDAIDPEKTMVLTATLHEPVPEFKGEFGFGNLGYLSSLTKLSNYRADDATVSVIRQKIENEEVPTSIVFKDGSGSKDQYRCMSAAIVEQVLKLQGKKFKGANWKITIDPTIQKVNQLSEVASIYSGIEPTFSVTVEDGNLVFGVGNAQGALTGRRIFATDVTGKLDAVWSWKLSTVLSILKLGVTGTCVMKFSEGVCQIDIDSGIALYSYILPALMN
jgi:hypothetical protein